MGNTCSEPVELSYSEPVELPVVSLSNYEIFTRANTPYS